MLRTLTWTALLLVTSLTALDAWYSADMNMGMRTYPVTARIRIDTVQAYKGEHRIAAREIAGQTYPAYLYSYETQYRSADTTFHIQGTGLFRTGSTSRPVWQNTVRSGMDQVEWTRRHFLQKPVKTEFHSLLHGDGSHTFEDDAIPEEFLYLLAVTLDSVRTHQELKVLAPVWEQPYSTGAWTAVGNYTGQKLRIDGVDCYQVVYLRSDGSTAEYFVSTRGRQIMRYKSFRGTWFSRIQ